MTKTKYFGQMRIHDIISNTKFSPPLGGGESPFGIIQDTGNATNIKRDMNSEKFLDEHS